MSILAPHQEEDRVGTSLSNFEMNAAELTQTGTAVASAIDTLRANLYNSRKSQKVGHARPRQTELLAETPASKGKFH